MKARLFLASLFALVLLIGAASPNAEPRLYINSPIKKSTSIQLAYEVTLPGFVELHLFDPDPDPDVRGEPE
ncbi:MAG: hypothetical protein AAFP02_06905, partial [Bacteroidota bacterium]